MKNKTNNKTNKLVELTSKEINNINGGCLGIILIITAVAGIAWENRLAIYTFCKKLKYLTRSYKNTHPKIDHSLV